MDPTLDFKDSHPESLREFAGHFAVGYRREIGDYLLLHKAVNIEEVRTHIIEIIDILLLRDGFTLGHEIKSDLVEICVMNLKVFPRNRSESISSCKAGMTLVLCFVFLTIYCGHLARSILMGFFASCLCLALIFASITYIVRKQGNKEA